MHVLVLSPNPDTPPRKCHVAFTQVVPREALASTMSFSRASLAALLARMDILSKFQANAATNFRTTGLRKAKNLAISQETNNGAVVGATANKGDSLPMKLRLGTTMTLPLKVPKKRTPSWLCRK